MFLEESFIFYPTRYPDGDWSPEELDIEDVWFDAADGTRLHGWYCRHEDPRAVVLYAHGNAGNLSHRAPILRELHDRHGLSVMIFDYRGYGRSAGRPNEPGVLQDARAARDWLAHREGIDPRDVVLLGRSLGGAVMVDLAARDGARGLILESTFTSIPDVAARSFPMLPMRTLLRSRFDSLSKIPDYHGPLLQSHGDADTIIPYALGRRLFEAAHEPKRFLTIPAADHNDPQSPEYYRALDDFLAALPDRARK
jgi:fermentation-respiration switch protein FrsA (DUF1100 family)